LPGTCESGLQMTMGERKILIGCNEVYLAKALMLLLGESCQITERTRFDEVVREACNGGFDLVVLYSNCLSPPLLCPGGLVENSVAAIRTIKSFGPAPIIALTSMVEWHGPLLAAGADACLTTPFKAAEFKDAVSHCLSVGERG
jgi:CheY-like chemotaxis protein